MSTAYSPEKIASMLNKYKKILDKSKKYNKEENEKVTFKVKKETQTVRILPFSNGEPFQELKFHYNVQGRSYYCPTNDKEPCPFCEQASMLWDNAGEDQLLKELAKKVTAKSRLYSPVIVRLGENRSEDHVRYWSFGSEVQKDIIALFVNPKVGIIFDPDFGRDLEITGESASFNGKAYLKPRILPEFVTSPAIEGGEEKIKELLASIKSPTEVFGMKTDRSYAELQKVFNEWENSGFKAVRSRNDNSSDDEDSTSDHGDTEDVGSDVPETPVATNVQPTQPSVVATQPTAPAPESVPNTTTSPNPAPESAIANSAELQARIDRIRNAHKA